MKISDKVKVISARPGESRAQIGKIGVITKIKAFKLESGSTNFYEIKDGVQQIGFYTANELELV